MILHKKLIFTLSLLILLPLQSSMIPSRLAVASAIILPKLPSLISPILRRVSFKTPGIGNLFKNTQTGQMVKELRANPSDRKIVGTIFIQNCALNSAAAFGITHAVNTSTTATTLIYSVALASAVRSTAKSYSRIVEEGSIKRKVSDLQKQIGRVEENLRNKIEQAELNLDKKIGTTEFNLNNTIAATRENLRTTINDATADLTTAIHERVNATEAILGTQLDKHYALLKEHIRTNQNSLNHITAQLGITHEQLKALLADHHTLTESQKTILHILLNKKSHPNDIYALSQKIPSFFMGK